MGEHSAQLHEDPSVLGVEAIDKHRVIASIMEELEAVDWYDQRVRATTDETLAAVLAHNRDEEKEHAAMGLEWLRRHDEDWDRVLRLYLFTDQPITEIEEVVDAAGGGGGTAGTGGGAGRTGGGAGAAGSLGIGTLTGKGLV